MIPFLIFCLINFGLVMLSKKSFGVTLPVTLTGVTLLTYFGQFLFHTFNVGVWLCVGMAVAGAVLLIVRRKDRDFISRCFSVGFFVFFAICILFLVLDYGRWLTTWDEYSHWGKMLKEMFRLDRFYTEHQSNLTAHKDYPPFAQIFELIWCKLSWKYTEGTATAALDILGFSMILPLVIERLECKKEIGKIQRFLSSLAIAVVLLIVILNFDNVQSMTLNLDLLLPLYYVALIMMIADKELRKSKFGFIMILLGQFGLILTKQMGIAFVLLVWFFYTMSEVLDAVNLRKENLRYKGLLAVSSLAVLITPFISNGIWSRYVSSLGEGGQFSLSKINLKTLFRVIAGGGDWLQRITFVRYIRALFTTNITTGLFPMTYVSAIVVSFCILVIMSYAFRTVVTKGEMLRYGLLFALGSAGYAFTMLTMYLFCYTEGEMSVLASFERYMCTYVVSQYMILLLLLLKLLNRMKIDVCSYAVVCTLLGIGLITVGADGWGKLMPKKFTEKNMVEYKEQADVIQMYVPEGTEVYMISNLNAVDATFTAYYLDNILIDNRAMSSNVATFGAENVDYWNDIVNCIREDGYVYVCDATDNVNDALAKYAEEGEITDQTLYVAEDENGEFKLRRAW